MTSSKAMKHTMFDEFQIKGHWWIPNTDNKVSGILFYRKDGIELELIGCLGKHSLTQSFDILFGISDKGEKFTLMDAINNKHSISFPGFQTDTYSVNSFLVGEHLENFNQIEFDYINFYPTYFSKWIEKELYSEELFPESDAGKGLKAIHFKELNCFNEYVESIDSEVIEIFTTNVDGDYDNSINWKYKGGFKIKPKERKSIDWFRDTMYKLQSLYTLFIGHPTYMENVFIYTETNDSKKPNNRISFFTRQSDVKIKDKFHSRNTMISYSQIDNNFGVILNNWFEKLDILKDAINIYQGDFYIDMYLNTRFLNSVQTLEIFHRSLFEGKTMNEEEYQKFTSELSDLLETKFPQEYSKLIRGKLEHGNEYSLSKRLRGIINSLNSESKTYLIGNSDNRGKFVQQLVDTRNYLTHFDKGKKKNILESADELFYTIQRLKALTTLLIFIQIGIKEDTALSSIKEQYMYSINKAKEILN